jgi:ATP-dependent helicase/nuclease subunit A
MRALDQKIDKPTKEQQQAADPAQSVWVSANAGAGKTTVLVDRVIRLMLGGAEPETILCLTFTKTAAAEMQTKLFKRLSGWTLASDDFLREALNILGVDGDDARLVAARRLFTRALETPGGLKIQTIHAFSEKLLRLFPVEAGVAPGFRVLEDIEQAEILETSLISVLRSAEGNQNSELGEALALIANNANETKFTDLIRQFTRSFADIRQRVKDVSTISGFREILARGLELDPAFTLDDAERDLLDIDEKQYQAVSKPLKSLSSHFGMVVGELLEKIAKAKSSAERLDELELFSMTDAGKPRSKDRYLNKTNQGLYPSEFQWVLDEAFRVFKLFQRRDLVERLDATAALYLVGYHIMGLYLARKSELGAFDFSDLIERAAGLLERSGNAQWVLYKIDRGLKHVLVDEAQDTSPKQWSIIKAITEEFFAGRGVEQEQNRTLFVVGDRKQSIYSFQGADAQAYEKTFDDLKKQVVAFPSVPLNLSYRTVPEILTVVDQVFGKAHTLMGFAKDEERGHTATRKAHGVFELWPMLGDDKPTDPEPWGAPVDAQAEGSHRRKLANSIAREVKSWIGARILPTTGKPVQPGDVLILFRKRGQLFSQVLAALRREEIEVAGADRLKMNASLTVQDLLALGQVLLLPEDDHALACVLKSPFVPHPASEDDLFALAHDRGAETLMQRLQATGDKKQKANADMIGAYQAMVGLGPYALYSSVLQCWRNAQVMRLGPEAADASDAFLEYCLSYEQQQGISLAGFVAWFEQAEIELRREMEAGGGEVRLMTVHGSKGLEAPIVILADAAETRDARNSPLIAIASEARDHPLERLLYWTLSGRVDADVIDDWKGVHKRRGEEEKKRLLYVAMTRARDELYIAGADENAKANDDSLYFFVQEALKNAEPKVKDQLQDLQAENFEHKIKRRLGAVTVSELPAPIDVDELSKLPHWITTAPKTEQRKTSRRLTGLVNAKSMEVRQAAEAARRGTAIHVMLEALASVPAEKREALARRKSRSLGLTWEDAEPLLELLQHEDLQVFMAADARSEVELFLPSGDGVISGRIDRMLVRDEAIWLLDYKTTRKPSSVPDVEDPSVQQLSLYAAGLRAAYPGRAVKACLVFTENSNLHWLSEDLMSRACDRAPARSNA